MTKLEDDLRKAREQLAIAEVALDVVVEAEATASISAEKYSAWLGEVAACRTEVARLTTLAAKLTADVEAARKRASDEVQAELEAAANRAAQDAAELVRKTVPEVTRKVREMLLAIADADEQVAIAQRTRRPDLPRLPTAEQIARQATTRPRQVLSEKVVEAWVFAETGHRLGDEQATAVKVNAEGKGWLPRESGAAIVVKRRFRKTEFLAEERAPSCDALATVIAMPALIAGGIPGWTPMFSADPSDVRKQLHSLADAPEDRRRLQVEWAEVREDEKASAA